MSGYKILGPQDSGKGILIEYDAGYVNPNEGRNLDIIKESRNMLDHSKPFEFYAVLQKYDTPNRNGRVYPEKILKREYDKSKRVYRSRVKAIRERLRSNSRDLRRPNGILQSQPW